MAAGMSGVENLPRASRCPTHGTQRRAWSRTRDAQNLGGQGGACGTRRRNSPPIVTLKTKGSCTPHQNLSRMAPTLHVAVPAQNGSLIFC